MAKKNINRIVIYFIAGTTPTTSEQLEIDRIDAIVRVRSVLQDSRYSETKLEPCDAVAGVVPAAYANLPRAVAVGESYMPKLQVVAHRGKIPSSLGGGAGGTPVDATLSEARYSVKVGPGRVSDIRLLCAGSLVQTAGNGDGLIPVNLQSVKLAVEQATPSNGQIAKLSTFNGGETITVQKGRHIITDPVGLSAEAGSILKIQAQASVSSGEQFPIHDMRDFTGDVMYRSVNAAAAGQVGTITTWDATGRTAGNAWSPAAVLGRPEKAFPAVIGVGDSIFHADSTDNADNNGNRGWVARGLWNYDGSNVIPMLKVAFDGDAAYRYGAYFGGERRLAMLQYGTHLLCTLGVNDLTSTFTPSAILAWLQYIWLQGKIRGMHVTQSLITPKTTGTFTTEGDQTHATYFDPGGRRDQLNALIRAQVGVAVNGIVLLDQIIDPNPYIESTANPGKWLANMTNDGLHPNNAGYIAMAPAATNWALTLTV